MGVINQCLVIVKKSEEWSLKQICWIPKCTDSQPVYGISNSLIAVGCPWDAESRRSHDAQKGVLLPRSALQVLWLFTCPLLFLLCSSDKQARLYQQRACASLCVDIQGSSPPCHPSGQLSLLRNMCATDNLHSIAQYLRHRCDRETRHQSFVDALDMGEVTCLSSRCTERQSAGRS